MKVQFTSFSVMFSFFSVFNYSLLPNNFCVLPSKLILVCFVVVFVSPVPVRVMNYTENTLSLFPVYLIKLPVKSKVEDLVDSIYPA